MVDCNAQLYTIEGIAASLILLLTAYLVVNSTSVYTPGDAHISDMQLEVTGSDALAMMNHVTNVSPNGRTGRSPLQTVVENGDSAGFVTMYNSIVNNETANAKDRIQFSANLTYRKNDGTINITTPLGKTRSISGGEHAVRATQWIIADIGDPPGNPANVRKRAVLVEVFLWRD